MAPKSRRGEVLVVIVNDQTDWQIVREQLWYRVPVRTAPRGWTPKWIAFYQTKVFGEEAFSIRYYGKVEVIKRVRRSELFPSSLPSDNADREYYQVFIERLEILPRPIVSHRLRRVVFIPTTLEKLHSAEEINDLFDDSPLENSLWSELKGLHMQAERQWHLQIQDASYFLDFAVFCANGKIDIETDGDRWHTDPERVPEDNRRNNAVASDGWQVLRFNTQQICEEMKSYCIPKITATVNHFGGLKPFNGIARTYYQSEGGTLWQMLLFEGKAAYDSEDVEDEVSWD